MALDPTDRQWDSGVTAARAVLLEVTRVLSEYKGLVVLVGGWVPELLFGQHPGSLDVDLALDHTALDEVGYATIRQLLERAGYIQDSEREFVFWRHLAVEGRVIEVELDLLAGEYDGTARKRRHQRVQDITARKARGADLAHVAPLEVPFEGTLPSGAKDRTILRVASLPAFLVMKASALASRLKPKDAFDIVFCLRHYQSDIEALKAEFIPYLVRPVVLQALTTLAEKFASPEHFGPVSAAEFLGETDPEALEILRRDAYERVQALLRLLGNTA